MPRCNCNLSVSSHNIFSDTWHDHGKFMKINPHCFRRYFTIFAISSDCTYWNNRYNIVYFRMFRLCIVQYISIDNRIYILVYIYIVEYDIRKGRILYTLLCFIRYILLANLMRSRMQASDIVEIKNILLATPNVEIKNCCYPVDSNPCQRVPSQARYHRAAPRGILISTCCAVFMSPS